MTTPPHPHTTPDLSDAAYVRYLAKFVPTPDRHEPRSRTSWEAAWEVAQMSLRTPPTLRCPHCGRTGPSPGVCDSC